MDSSRHLGKFFFSVGKGCFIFCQDYFLLGLDLITLFFQVVAHIYVQLGQVEKGQDLLRKATKVDSRDAQVIILSGACCYNCYCINMGI